MSKTESSDLRNIFVRAKKVLPHGSTMQTDSDSHQKQRRNAKENQPLRACEGFGFSASLRHCDKPPPKQQKHDNVSELLGQVSLAGRLLRQPWGQDRSLGAQARDSEGQKCDKVWVPNWHTLYGYSQKEPCTDSLKKTGMQQKCMHFRFLSSPETIRTRRVSEQELRSEALNLRSRMWGGGASQPIWAGHQY